MVFAAGGPVTARQLAQVLPDGVEAEAVLAELAARYALFDYPQPGGGCMLTSEGFGKRLRVAPCEAPP